jgi:polyhydroxyalkanoate synthase subunit PhaC
MPGAFDQTRVLMIEGDVWWMQTFAAADGARQALAAFLGFLGLGPSECRYRIIASGAHWRLRAYAASANGPSVLIVSAPIKRPYIWDISHKASVIRHCLGHGLRIYLIEWLLPHEEPVKLGLDEYAEAIGAAVTHVARDGVNPPFLMGHSIGGTLAAMFAALEPDRLRGLVLLSSPLCFRRGASRFGDTIATLLPSTLSECVSVPGSLISQASVWASPEVFLWSRFADAVFSSADPEAVELHARIERWSLDEVPLAGRLVAQIEQWLYGEDRFCREALVVGNQIIGPARLHVPTLAVVNTADDIATSASMAHFLNTVPRGYVRSIEYRGELGVGFQHVALLIGRKARAMVWPAIVSWLETTRT